MFIVLLKVMLEYSAEILFEEIGTTLANSEEELDIKSYLTLHYHIFCFCCLSVCVFFDFFLSICSFDNNFAFLELTFITFA